MAEFKMFFDYEYLNGKLFLKRRRLSMICKANWWLVLIQFLIYLLSNKSCFFSKRHSIMNILPYMICDTRWTNLCYFFPSFANPWSKRRFMLFFLHFLHVCFILPFTGPPVSKTTYVAKSKKTWIHNVCVFSWLGKHNSDFRAAKKHEARKYRGKLRADVKLVLAFLS